MRRLLALEPSICQFVFIASPTALNSLSDAFGLAVRSERTGSPSARTKKLELWLSFANFSGNVIQLKATLSHIIYFFILPRVGTNHENDTLGLATVSLTFSGSYHLPDVRKIIGNF